MKKKYRLLLCTVLTCFCSLSICAQMITTIAGGGVGDGLAANNPNVNLSPGKAVRDASGNTYIADTYNHRVRKVDASGIITTIAGNGIPGFGGDNGLAVNAVLNFPTSVALDQLGNIYLTDMNNSRIRKISPSGIITTVAGNGTMNDSGDNGPASSATLRSVTALAIDENNNIYLCGQNGPLIRKIDSNGIITTIAGTYGFGFSGDNGPALSAQFGSPSGLALDALGNLYIADRTNKRVRKINTSGVITTYAGNGTSGVGGDNGPATSANLGAPTDVTLDPSGNLFIADLSSNIIRKVDNTGIITSITSGIYGYSGSGLSAIQAALLSPAGISVTPTGDLLIADSYRIQKITSGIITTVAGSGNQTTFFGDNGPAARAVMGEVFAAAFDQDGNFYFSDGTNFRIRKISTGGTITTVAGVGSYGYSGDNGPATSAQIFGVYGIVVDKNGNLIFVDTNNNRIRKINTSGVITTIAGTGNYGFSGDNSPATSASFFSPIDLAMDTIGNIYICDASNHRIRKINTSGIITTIAGTGYQTYAGDNGLAVNADLKFPRAITLDPLGNIYIADGDKIRKINNSGIITTIAGTGVAGYSGDGGAATSAQMNIPSDLATDISGNVFVTEHGNSVVRKINSVGIISTIAGVSLMPLFYGDGGLAVNATLAWPEGIALSAKGDIYISDRGNKRIRKINNPIQVISFPALKNACAGTSVQLNASSSSGLPVTYVSSDPIVTINGNIATVTGNVDRVINITAKQGGNVSFTPATDVTLQLQVFARPSADIIGPDQICPQNGITPDQFQLINSDPQNLTYAWSNGSTTSSATVESYVDTGETINLSVTVIRPSSGCMTWRNKIITVKPAPLPYVTGNFTACAGAGSYFILTAHPALGYPASTNGYVEWNMGNSNFLVRAPNEPLNFQWEGTFSARMIYDNYCRSAPVTFQTTFLLPPPQPNITGQGNYTVCEGVGKVLTVSATPAGNYNYLWSNGFVGQSQTFTQNHIATAQTIDNDTGCVSAVSPQAQLRLTVRPAPNLTVIKDRGFCSYGYVRLTGSLNTGYTYLWSNGATTRIINVTYAGQYSVEVTQISTGCSTTQTIMVPGDGCQEGILSSGRQRSADESALIEEKSFSNAAVSVYPNPAKHKIMVIFKEQARVPLQLDLIDLIGQKQLSETVNPGITEIEIEVAKLPEGVYLINIPAMQFVFKVLIRH